MIHEGGKIFFEVHGFYGRSGPISAFCDHFRLIGGVVSGRFPGLDKTMISDGGQ